MPKGLFIRTEEHKKNISEALKGENSPTWKGGKNFTVDGYVRIFKPDHPKCQKNGYILEHRLVMEEFLGRYVDSDERIHHIDYNKTNNKIENLHLCKNIKYILTKRQKNIKYIKGE